MEFDVKVYRERLGVVVLRLEGDSQEHARRQAESMGYHVIAVDRRRGSTRLRNSSWWTAIGARFSVALFSQELLALLQSGLSLIESLDVLHRKAKQADSKRVLRLLHQALQEGQPLSRALGTIPEHFSPLYVATIRTSEKTGDLAESLERYIEYDRQVSLMRDKIVSASIYPILLVVVGALVVLFLLVYVVPRFSLIYADLSTDLPLMTRVMMAWGRGLSNHSTAIGAVAAALTATLYYALTRPMTRSYLQHGLWALPWIGENLRLYQLARFSRTTAMLLEGGIPIVSALEMTDGLLRQPALQLGLKAAIREIKEGRTVSATFEQNGLANEVGVRLLAVGERSGDMARIMGRIAKLYDDEVGRWIERFIRLFEPVLMIFIGLLIGGIVLLMYMPIFQLANSIQ